MPEGHLVPAMMRGKEGGIGGEHGKVIKRCNCKST